MSENTEDPRSIGYAPATPRNARHRYEPNAYQQRLGVSLPDEGYDEDQPGEVLDSPVYAQLRRAQRSLDQAAHLLSNLHSRLEPILAPETTQPGPNETMKMADKLVESPLASSIRQLDDRAVDIVQRISVIDNLLEI